MRRPSSSWDSTIRFVKSFEKTRYCCNQLTHKVCILDLAAGTGLLGAEIGRHGYCNIDGLDCSLGMLGQAKTQCIYKNYIKAHVDGLGSIPVNDETYDVIVSSNGLAPGQIYPSALPELLRVLRPGGYIILVMKASYLFCEYICVNIISRTVTSTLARSSPSWTPRSTPSLDRGGSRSPWGPWSLRTSSSTRTAGST